nr:MAG TPA: hypothetical protein [Caudoviricetes sp.]
MKVFLASKNQLGSNSNPCVSSISLYPDNS